jgi:hypothetical protein
MQCSRCHGDKTDPRIDRWCETCEHAYDTWSRQHATDIIWSALGGMVVVATIAVGLPLLGVPWVFATLGIAAGAGVIVTHYRWNRARRRGQFLKGAAMPRAYLPDKTST